jgi:hypothetical protein
VTDDWYRVQFARPFDAPPVVVANIATFAGGDTAGVRMRRLSGSGFEVMVEEEQSSDSEVLHVAERVSYLAALGEIRILDHSDHLANG